MDNGDLTIKINHELLSLQKNMIDTIKKEEERGSSMKKLSERTTKLRSKTHLFKETSKEVKQKMWYKNFKVYIIIGTVIGVLVILYMVV